jgi:predicted nucleic-acid-binding Zn-ribbon protein
MAKTKPKAEINWTCTKCGATVYVSENLHAPLCHLYRQEAVEKPHEQGREY